MSPHAPTCTAAQRPRRCHICTRCGLEPSAGLRPVGPARARPASTNTSASLRTSAAPPRRQAKALTATPLRCRATPLPSSARDAPTSAPIVEPARLVSALDKLANVGHAPEPAWLDMYLAVSEPVLNALSVRQMATVARALGRLGVEVPERWARALTEASEAALPSAESAGDVAELLTWAAGDARLAPGPAWVGAALQQIRRLSSERPGDLSPRQAADVAWAVARMGYRPADALLDCLAAATLGVPYGDAVPGWRRTDGDDGGGAAAARGPGEPPQGLPGLGAGEGMEMQNPASGLSELPPEQLARLAWAFASYNYFPPDPWVQAYWLRGIWTRGLSPEAATAVLWSLGCLQLPLEGLWLRNYCLTTAGRLHEIPPEGLINGLWAIAACREVARAADAAEAAAAAAPTTAAATAAAATAGPPPPSGRPQLPPGRDAADAAAAAETEAPSGPEAAQGDGADAAAEAAAPPPGGVEEAIEKLRGMQAGLEYMAGQALLEKQLEALARLRDGGGAATAAQREALAQLQEALDRRLSRGAEEAADGGGGAAAAEGDEADGPLPAAWTAEWYDATLPFLEQLDKTLVVKALWAAASLELQPPAGWLQRGAAAAAALVAAGAMEPLEVLYASRSADSLLSRRVVAAARQTQRSLRRLGAEAGEAPVEAPTDKEEEQAGDAEAEARETLGRFASESFAALGRQKQLPPAWRRLNVRFPPYAQPKPGTEGPQPPPEPGTGGSSAGGGNADPDGGSRRRAVGPVVPGAGLLRPFQ